tara:strand:+ start:7640 stop:8290 length:651 start_codon:yes stop_codon:yes gene_type:complete
MISFEDVTFLFKDGIGIEEADFSINKNEFTCFLGPTGAGKTTLLRLIYMDLIPQKGKIIIDEFDSTTIKKRHIPKLRRKVGMVFQDFALLNDRNVFENIAISLHVMGIKIREVRERVNAVIDELALNDRKNHLPSQLSGGEQQIVSLARAVVKKPIVVLADEPTGNLDPASSFKILKLLEKINENGTAVVMASHDYNLIKDRGYRFINVKEGKIYN